MVITKRIEQGEEATFTIEGATMTIMAPAPGVASYDDETKRFTWVSDHQCLGVVYSVEK